MEGFKLNISTAIDEHFHHKLEVVWVANVLTHCREVMSVQ